MFFGAALHISYTPGQPHRKMSLYGYLPGQKLLRENLWVLLHVIIQPPAPPIRRENTHTHTHERDTEKGLEKRGKHYMKKKPPHPPTPRPRTPPRKPPVQATIKLLQSSDRCHKIAWNSILYTPNTREYKQAHKAGPGRLLLKKTKKNSLEGLQGHLHRAGGA